MCINATRPRPNTMMVTLAIVIRTRARVGCVDHRGAEGRANVTRVTATVTTATETTIATTTTAAADVGVNH